MAKITSPASTPHGVPSGLVSLPKSQKGREIMSKTEKVNESSPVSPVLDATPDIQEIAGLKTCVLQLEAFVKNLNESVNGAALVEREALDMAAELHALKDNKAVRLMLLASGFNETKLKESIAESSRKAVNSSVLSIREQMKIVGDLTGSLVSKYGNVAEFAPPTQTGSPTGRKVPAGANITLKVFESDAIPSEMKKALNLVFNPVTGSDYGFVTGTGHPKGNFFLSNLKNW
jgi:hypothetical protein